MKIQIDKTIGERLPYCQLGYLILNGVSVKGTPPALSREITQLQAEMAERYQMNVLPQVPKIMAVRNMYKKLSVDPSRYRPASEALVRRVLQNRSLYFVNSAVDVNNFCSLKYLLPFGLYDLDKIAGDCVMYRIVGEGAYTNIAGHTIQAGHRPYLCDADDIFGNPSSDSRRTAVTLSTERLLCVIYADEEESKEELAAMLDFTAEMLMRYNGGILVEKGIAAVE
ncbi:B3/B4 domain-containing protein [Anaeromusa acidaminophila]|uniref:B3/B4 domain-containing protein n=1 Tax=Anaeromusa acidaminophila TaxID=81464 RepID=UPI00036A151E|nr:phenylalanine--tRNA ligase beta subunit-related protein [Anaeromusa acidaminophila]